MQHVENAYKRQKQFTTKKKQKMKAKQHSTANAQCILQYDINNCVLCSSLPYSKAGKY